MHTGLTGTAETSRLSPRNGFTAYTYSPRGSGLSCPRCRRKTPAGVAPGSRRQDHTTSPSAAAFTSDGRTPPDAATSIASCALRIVTIAKRPSVGTGRASYAPDFYFCKAEYFSTCGLTRFCEIELICPSRQFVALQSFRGERSESYGAHLVP